MSFNPIQLHSLDISKKRGHLVYMNVCILILHWSRQNWKKLFIFYQILHHSVVFDEEERFIDQIDRLYKEKYLISKNLFFHIFLSDFLFAKLINFFRLIVIKYFLSIFF